MARWFVAVALVSMAVCVVYGQKGSRTRQAPEPLKAVAKVQGNGVEGMIFFDCAPNKAQVRVHGKITGLTPGRHGFHIHQFGDMTDSCVSMGPHFNPGKHQHGSPSDMARHVGDLGNIEANAQGVATIDVTDTVISLKGPNSIIGRGVVVHAKADDLGRGSADDSKTTGAAGARVGCGVVGFAKMSK